MSKAQRSSLSARDFQTFLGIAVAALAAAVVWLATNDRAPAGNTAALKSHVALLEQNLAQLQQNANTLATTTAAELDRQAAQLKQLRASPQAPAATERCLREVQQEIDDIRGFIAFRGPIRKRVSGDCATLLKPRFGG